VREVVSLAGRDKIAQRVSSPPARSVALGRTSAGLLAGSDGLSVAARPHPSLSSARTVRITSLAGCSSGSLATELAALALLSVSPCAAAGRAPRRFISRGPLCA
jgi:hypothetical protein